MELHWFQACIYPLFTGGLAYVMLLWIRGFTFYSLRWWQWLLLIAVSEPAVEAGLFGIDWTVFPLIWIPLISAALLANWLMKPFSDNDSLGTKGRIARMLFVYFVGSTIGFSLIGMGAISTIISSAVVAGALHFGLEMLHLNKKGEAKDVEAMRGLVWTLSNRRWMATFIGCGAASYVWFERPVLAFWKFYDLPELVTSVVLTAYVWTLIWNVVPRMPVFGNLFDGWHVARLTPNRRVLVGLVFCWIIVELIPAPFSSQLFPWVNAKSVAIIAPHIERRNDFPTDLAALNNGKELIITPNVAENVAKRILGRSASMTAQSQTSKETQQTIVGTFEVEQTLDDGTTTKKTITANGEPWYISPLEPASFGKQIFVGNTKGFIMFPATSDREEDRWLVTGINGKPLDIKYHCYGGYFNYNVGNRLYRLGYMLWGMGDYRFILDNNGRPYCVVTRYQNATGYETPLAQDVIATDVQTGEITIYPLDKVPAWIDRIHTPSQWLTHLENWGRYRNGGNIGWPSLYAYWVGAGLEFPTNSIRVFTGSDKETYYFTVMTSNNASATGYALGNARTLQTRIYNVQGGKVDWRYQKLVLDNNPALQKIAQDMEGKDGNMIKAIPDLISSPQPMMIAGEPTFFMVANNVQGEPISYAYASIAREGTIKLDAPANNPREAYIESVYAHVGSSKTTTVTGTLANLVPEVVNGETRYFLFLKEYPEPGPVFRVETKVNPWVRTLKNGDKLELTFSGDITHPIADQPFIVSGYKHLQ